MKISEQRYTTKCGCFFAFESTLWLPGAFEDFRVRTTGSYVALRVRNSGANRGRELFKRSKDSASILVCTRKKTFCWGGVRIVCEWRHK